MGILLLTAMAAGAVVMPQQVTIGRSWLTFEDYPADELRSDHNGFIHFKTIVNPDGRAEACLIEASTSTLGNRDKAEFCGSVKARYKSAKVLGPDGEPTYYVREETFSYYLPDTGGLPTKQRPDFSIEVQALPKPLKGTIEVLVNVAVDNAGKLLQCDLPVDAPQPALAKLACGQLPAIWDPMPEKNAAGEPIAYIRQLRVEFREASAAAR